jgi:hypothetical protein
MPIEFQRRVPKRPAFFFVRPKPLAGALRTTLVHFGRVFDYNTGYYARYVPPRTDSPGTFFLKCHRYHLPQPAGKGWGGGRPGTSLLTSPCRINKRLLAQELLCVVFP